MHNQLGGEGVRGGGGTPDFKWQEWSNGGKNHNTKKSLGLQTKLPKNTWTKIQPPKPFYLSHIVTATQKKKFAKIFLPKKILKSKISHPKDSFDHRFHLKPRPSPPSPQCMVITQVTPRAPLPVVLGKLEDPSINCKSQILVRLASWKLITANSLFYRHLYKRDTSLKQKPDLVLAFLLTTPFSLLLKKTNI